MNVFNEEEYTLIFDFYLNKINRGDNLLVYREFITSLYNVNVTLNTFKNQEDKLENQSFTKNKYDIYDDTV